MVLELVPSGRIHIGQFTPYLYQSYDHQQIPNTDVGAIPVRLQRDSLDDTKRSCVTMVST